MVKIYKICQKLIKLLNRNTNFLYKKKLVLNFVIKKNQTNPLKI